MLKTFMQPGNPSNARTDSTKSGHSAYPTARTAEASREETARVATQSGHHDEGSKLIVGPNIKLKGSEITDCEILVVEGRVEASMNSRDIRIAEGGVFSGKAEIDVAEVRGTFEGELTARKRLVVYATGRVNGTIRYGALMVEEGGTITGGIVIRQEIFNESEDRVINSTIATYCLDAQEIEGYSLMTQRPNYRWLAFYRKT